MSEWMYIVFQLLSFLAFDQNHFDTIYVNIVKQRSVSHYIITDTISGKFICVKSINANDSLPIYAFDPNNCVLKVEAFMKYSKKKLDVIIEPSIDQGQHLWIKAVRNEIQYSFRKKKVGNYMISL